MELYKKTIIVGYSGHSYEVIEALTLLGKKASYYSEKKIVKNNPYKLSFLGNELDIAFKGWNMNLRFVLGLGDNKLREKIGLLILKHKKEIFSVVHPKAIISETAELGNGIFVSKGALVNSFSKIGDFSILNTGCIIEHECILGRGVHVAPGAVVAGNVKIGNRSFIGANSVIKQGVFIGDDVIIGAGSVVVNDVPKNDVVYGNPAKNK